MKKKDIKFDRGLLYDDVLAFAEKKNKTIYDISVDMGLGNGAVWRLNNSDNYPSITNLLVICNHIEQSPAKYFTREN